MQFIDLFLRRLTQNYDTNVFIKQDIYNKEFLDILLISDIDNFNEDIEKRVREDNEIRYILYDDVERQNILDRMKEQFMNNGNQPFTTDDMNNADKNRVKLERMLSNSEIMKASVNLNEFEFDITTLVQTAMKELIIVKANNDTPGLDYFSGRRIRIPEIDKVDEFRFKRLIMRLIVAFYKTLSRCRMDYLREIKNIRDKPISPHPDYLELFSHIEKDIKYRGEGELIDIENEDVEILRKEKKVRCMFLPPRNTFNKYFIQLLDENSNPITDKATYPLVLQPELTFYVKGLTGESTSVSVSSGGTGDNLLHAIAEQMGIDVKSTKFHLHRIHRDERSEIGRKNLLAVTAFSDNNLHLTAKHVDDGNEMPPNNATAILRPQISRTLLSRFIGEKDSKFAHAIKSPNNELLWVLTLESSLEKSNTPNLHSRGGNKSRKRRTKGDKKSRKTRTKCDKKSWKQRKRNTPKGGERKHRRTRSRK